MQQIRDYGDQRLIDFCAYCGGSTGTRDHVPSRVLLDEPYPENLPVVPACDHCNNAFSIDEEYAACLVECVLNGSAEASDQGREKIRRVLGDKPALASMLAKARQKTESGITFSIEHKRIRNVVMKLARGHAVYENNEPQLDEPKVVAFRPIITLTNEERSHFESLASTTGIAGWPAVGSRAMQRLIQGAPESPAWIVVQPGRYRYLVSVADGITVRMVFSEYLACEVRWA